MSKLYRYILGFVFSFVLVCCAGSSMADVDFNRTNFPDANFLLFLQEEGVDTDKNAILDDDEISRVTSINCRNFSISDLKGIELFPNLASLDCSYNNLTYLDTSKNTALKSCVCDNNKIANLDISKNTDLVHLNCSANKLEAIDVSKNVAMTKLLCYGNNITNLDISNNTALYELSCEQNNIFKLDVTNNDSLRILTCSSNQLSSLDISKNIALKKLDCSNNHLSSLNVSSNKSLESLVCFYNQLDRLDLVNVQYLGVLRCYYNKITELDISKCASLIETITTYGTLDGDLYRYSNDPAKVFSCDATVRTYLGGSWIEAVPAQIELNELSASLLISDIICLEATIKPSYAVTSLLWSSSNTSVARVSSKGVVSAKDAGVADITVTTANGKTATCTVNVKNPDVSSVFLNKNGTISLPLGKKLTLKATILPKYAIKDVTWQSSKPSIATISASGVVTPVKTGTTKITVKAVNGKKASVKINVVTPEAKKVAIDKKSLVLKVGSTGNLIATVTPSEATQKVKWESSNKKIATVSKSGVVKAKKTGTVKITATATNGKKASVRVKVIKDDPSVTARTTEDETPVEKPETSESSRNNNRIKSGWVFENNGWYYYDEHGNTLKGWLSKTVDDGIVWYWLNEETGAMASEEWVKINGCWYYFGANGEMYTGLQLIDGQWELFDSNGVWQFSKN